MHTHYNTKNLLIVGTSHFIPLVTINLAKSAQHSFYIELKTILRSIGTFNVSEPEKFNRNDSQVQVQLLDILNNNIEELRFSSLKLKLFIRTYAHCYFTRNKEIGTDPNKNE